MVNCQYRWLPDEEVAEFREDNDDECDCSHNASIVPTVEFAGQSWCLLHLPMSAKNDWREGELNEFRDVLASICRNAKVDGKPADLRGAQIPGDVLIQHKGNVQTTFPSSMPRLLLDGAVVAGILRVSGVQLTGGVSARRATFSGELSLRGSQIHKSCDFRGATFREAAVFDNCDMRERVSFGFTQFGVNYRSKKDRQSANAVTLSLKDAKLHAFLDLSGVEVSGDLLLTGASCNEGLSLSGARIRGDFDFTANPQTFNGPPIDIVRNAAFDGCTFEKGSVFVGRKFRGATSFVRTVFSVAPDFSFASLHPSANFLSARFKDKKTPNAAAFYRILKVEMERLRDRDQEAKFFALEQLGRLHQFETPRAIKALSRLYHATSNYGQSVLRPVLLLLVASAIAACCYAESCLRFHTHGKFGLLDAESRDLPRALECVLPFTVEQVVRPFAIWTRRYVSFAPKWVQSDLSDLQWIAMAHSIVSITLLALMIVSLRWRFRKR